MTLADVVQRLELKVLSGSELLEREVTGGYTGDLLSDVMANADTGQVWITLQAHINIVAVGVLRELTGIILIKDRTPDEATLTKAKQENVPILQSDRPAFEISGLLFNLLNE
ncbi:MAG: serine kinase [Deltaproteobacteria bacterium]|nr:serine kinase [Deltaproteobacteria bacterium]MBW2050621.1 serine kinase [Deltaproteobacteria bacterium]MBW2139485.1 serine kinase [Deltaproteobacteria bacterium]MBW2322566.1 serine kinase [Deltaproteobacteria bacterium]